MGQSDSGQHCLSFWHYILHISSGSMLDLIYLHQLHIYPVFKNSVDPDQLATEKPADQDQHCFPCSF